MPDLEPTTARPSSSRAMNFLKSAALPVIGLGIAAGIYYAWPAGTVGQEEACVGTHLFSQAGLRDDNKKLFMESESGSNPRELKIGPACPEFTPSVADLQTSGKTQLCVGDDLAPLGAPANADCKVESITIAKQTY